MGEAGKPPVEVLGQGDAIKRMHALLISAVGRSLAEQMMECMGVRSYVQRVVPQEAATTIRAAVQEGSAHNLFDYYSVRFVSRDPKHPGKLIRIEEKW